MKRYHYQEISSTNDYAKEHLLHHVRVVVTADFQSRGRGRNKKMWLGDYGDNVYLSWGINHTQPIDFKDAMLYQAVGALAVRNTLVKFAPNVKFKLKYPNDVYAETGVGYRKICGVLVEHGFLGEKCKNTIIGIGININQKDFNFDLKDKAVSLKNLGISVIIDDLYNALITELNNLDGMPKANTFDLWVKHLNILGKEIVVVDKPGSWKVIKILDDGRILAGNTKTNEQVFINNGDSILYEL